MAIKRLSDSFLLDCYTGQGGFISGAYLRRFPRETDDKYRYRQESAVYSNFCKKIIDIYLGFLWRAPPSREADDLYAAFSKNADGAGKSLDKVLASAQRLAMLLGTVFLIVDRPRAVAATRHTLALPYIAIRLPDALAVGESEIDDKGEWIRIVFAETVGGKIQYRYFDREIWRVSADSAGLDILLDEAGNPMQGRHGLGRVPVVSLHTSRPLLPRDIRAQGFAFDLAHLCWDLYNQRSRIDLLFSDQAFSILALPLSDQSNLDAMTDMTVSTENAITYDPSHGGVPMFLAPEDGPVKTQMEWYQKTVEDIYRIANLEFVGGVQQSGVALSFHFQEANAGLTLLAELCEEAEQGIAQLVYLWMGRSFEGHIAYPRDFNLYDLASSLSQAMEAMQLSISPAFDKALKKGLARKVLGDRASPSVLAEIDREIDAQGDVYGDRVQQAAA